MKHFNLVVVMACAFFPIAGQAQERVTCGAYLEMVVEAKLTAIEGVKGMLMEAGQGFRFDGEESNEVKVAYVDSECTNADAWAGLALFDLLGK